MNKDIKKIMPFLKFIFSNNFLLKIVYILIIIVLLNILNGNLVINTDTYLRGYINNTLNGDIDSNVRMDNGVLRSGF